MTDEKDQLIQELSERIKSLEEKEDSRITWFGQVYDKKTFNFLIRVTIGMFALIAVGVIVLVTSDISNPFWAL